MVKRFEGSVTHKTQPDQLFQKQTDSERHQRPPTAIRSGDLNKYDAQSSQLLRYSHNILTSGSRTIPNSLNTLAIIRSARAETSSPVALAELTKTSACIDDTSAPPFF